MADTILRTLAMLRRRSIRLRIVVLVLVPVIALLGLYAEILNLSLGSLLTLNREAAIRGLVTVPVAQVQAQLGDERTLALEYLASPGKPSLRLLLTQEHRTDRTISRFGSAVHTALASGPVPKERAAFLSWQHRLGRITGLRTAVASQALSTVDAAGAYSDLVSEGDNVLNQAIVPVLTGPLGVQATDVLTMTRVAQAVGEESDLIRAGLAGKSFPAGNLSLISQLAVLHQEEWNQTLPDLDPVLKGYFRDLIPRSAQDTIARLETQATRGPAAAALIPPATWAAAESAYQKGYLLALDRSNATLARQAHAQGRDLILNLALIAGLGLVAILLVIGIGILVGRGLIRQLGDLRQSAVKLSAEQLPGAIGRLRAGEDVDVAAAVPELIPGSDEIGQVREAFNVAARTAIVAAADEVKIRRGVNDVFRSLARRNQSLLTRQLQLLDAMERRVHDPEELADLFKVDHMTTRMRRHAEGLLIVAGGSSGRAWREPVPIVDVMRAAAAEVEDYTRIKVNSRTSVTLAGHAVADIIHLLAELVENAATFSPANTPVRVEAEKVARGIAVEIEDRGLGLGEEQLAAINETLANPPLFDLSGSDQLGLFIAGQLGKRHDVRVTLRASAYDGITAVVLIPRELIVDFDEPDAIPVIAGIRELGGRPVPELAGAGVAVLSPGEAAGFLTASPAPATETWPASPAPATSAALAGSGQLTPADNASPALPRRDPGTTGLAWRQVTGYDWSASGSPHDPSPDGPAPPGSQGQDLPPEPPPAELDGLPVRVRQASLAPQLREPAVAAEAPPPAGLPSPDAARSTMAALQHGWQRGRSAADPDDQDEPAGHDQPRRDDEPQEAPDEGGAS